MRTLLPSVAAGAAGHLAYKYLEPRKVRWHLVLLVLVPLSLTSSLFPHYSSVILAAIVAWSSYVIVLVIFTIAYRLSPPHPLARYPGPFICKLTKMHFALVSTGGRQHIYYHELHRHYGDIVRTGPNELSFCTPELIVPMVGPRGMPKAEFWDGQFGEPEQKIFRSLVGIRDPQKHAKIRRIWARGFTPEALRSYHPILNKRVSNLISHFDARVARGQTIDLSKWISYFTYDVMSDIAFGDDIEMMQHQDSMGFWKTMEEAMPTGMVLAHIPWLTNFVYKVPGVARKIKIFRESARQRVLRRLERGSTTQDLFYHLMDEGKLDPTPPAIEQVLVMRL
ncbi:Cytochrome P450 67 [Termitomyces sp. T112]|nr:Cytochrome P450 67 [Termitomyces sp. T112]